MNNFLIAAQVFTAIFLIIFILIQQRGTALGSSFGGGGEFYGTRRGIQKKLFWATVFLGILFVILALLNLVFSK